MLQNHGAKSGVILKHGFCQNPRKWQNRQNRQNRKEMTPKYPKWPKPQIRQNREKRAQKPGKWQKPHFYDMSLFEGGPKMSCFETLFWGSEYFGISYKGLW